jgi:hypothetical protein
MLLAGELDGLGKHPLPDADRAGCGVAHVLQLPTNVVCEFSGDKIILVQLILVLRVLYSRGTSCKLSFLYCAQLKGRTQTAGLDTIRSSAT